MNKRFAFCHDGNGDHDTWPRRSNPYLFGRDSDQPGLPYTCALGRLGSCSAIDAVRDETNIGRLQFVLMVNEGGQLWLWPGNATNETKVNGEVAKGPILIDPAIDKVTIVNWKLIFTFVDDIWQARLVNASEEPAELAPDHTRGAARPERALLRTAEGHGVRDRPLRAGDRIVPVIGRADQARRPPSAGEVVRRITGIEVRVELPDDISASVVGRLEGAGVVVRRAEAPGVQAGAGAGLMPEAAEPGGQDGGQGSPGS